ncbi:MAG: hypothetical protein LBH44_07520 [Treponema sp.]|jgi:hypothetical protein|nr:hypothetical protein [Treponema sp.]
MNKQQESGAMPLELTNKIHRWNYDKSVEKMRELGKQWSKITAEVARELYLAKAHLTSQKGQHRNPDADDYILYTWDSYCGNIGLDRQIADYWIKKFVPREIAGTTKDVLLIKSPVKEDTTAARALLQSRVDEFLRTGERPKGWGDEEESEAKRRLENARLAEWAEKINAPVIATTKDYFSETMRRSKDIVNFKLDNPAQIHAQLKIFKYIEAYLDTFNDSELRARAAFNLALKTKNLANEAAELNSQLTEAEAAQ